MNNQLKLATFGGGCFWCIEAIFQQVKGVEKVISGYAGGKALGTPTYREVCAGYTGHAEVVQISFNPEIMSYEKLLIIFMTSHDPTTLNKQGADSGIQYRSVIYYHDDEQKEIAEEVIKQLSSYYDNPIVTELAPAGKFHAAEEYHQNYYNNNQDKAYCKIVITPKLAKLRKMYAESIKE